MSSINLLRRSYKKKDSAKAYLINTHRILTINISQGARIPNRTRRIRIRAIRKSISITVIRFQILSFHFNRIINVRRCERSPSRDGRVE